MSFIPVQFRKPDPAASKPQVGDPFHLPPPAGTVHLPEAPEISNRRANRDGFDLPDLSKDLKSHRCQIVPKTNASKSISFSLTLRQV